jgi:hypothetical protein
VVAVVVVSKLLAPSAGKEKREERETTGWLLLGLLGHNGVGDHRYLVSLVAWIKRRGERHFIAWSPFYLSL